MTRADKLLLAGILLAALALTVLGWQRLRDGTTSLQASIRTQGRLVRSVALAAAGGQAVYDIPGKLGTTRIEVDGARVHVLQAPCPNQLCVRQGWIARAGESLVCVPGEVVVRIEGAAPLDAVTR